MNWDHLKPQMAYNISNSPYRYEEVQAVLAKPDWYKLEPFDRWKCWTGHGNSGLEFTFHQLLDLMESAQGLDKQMWSEMLRYKLLGLVDGMIKEENAVESLELLGELEGAA